MDELELTNALLNGQIVALTYDGVYYLVDYTNRADENDEGRANIVCVSFENIYMVDNVVSEQHIEQFFIDDILANIDKFKFYELQEYNKLSNVFKVSDDEFEQIMGEEQLREFAIYQITDEFNSIEDEELLDRIESYIDTDRQQIIKNILKIVFVNDKAPITIHQAIDILALRMFDVEQLDIK